MVRPVWYAGLVLSQALHSFEEWYFELWLVYPPAATLSNAIGDDSRLWFGVFNAIVVAGLAMSFLLRDRSFGRRLAWFWVVVELVNGGNHVVQSVLVRGYFPGLFTSPLLPLCAVMLARELRADRARRGGEGFAE